MVGLTLTLTLTCLQFDPQFKHKRIDISADNCSVAGGSSSDRILALGSVGFSSGVHYWEVHINTADHGSVFVGVSPKHSKDPSDVASVVGKWSGWGFVNFRATMHKGNEKVCVCMCVCMCVCACVCAPVCMCVYQYARACVR